MIDALFITAEDATRTKADGQDITEGQVVALNSSGQLIGATAGAVPYGLSKLDSNSVRDFAFGEFGAFGTQKLTVVTKGICRVKDSVYDMIEVDTSVQPGASAVTKYVLAGVTFNVNDKVYAGTTAGVIVAAADAQGWVEIEVDAAIAVA